MVDEHDDGYALFDEPETQDGPGLFDDDPPMQDGPDLFGEEPEAEPEPAPEPAPAAAEPSSSLAPPPARHTTPAPSRPDAPLALYRRYRPDTFADVIGQDHVTVPLQRALENNKVGHAYLFSGPRGCGKTTSARILARCLNCEQGPTPTPCGECQSCVDLARGGPGSIDVIEIDAASHGGVDDARDLRERAFFAPVASRYKIYIVDEAHMVTTGGFNALLKLVEEPPPHAKFVFATTEPEKVIGTIRSRTHHYPFRLVPPRTLTSYLSEICDAEGVVVDARTLPLVVRAGGGSVRDSLSVLDQLLGGAGAEGVEYEQAAALLGYTPDSLLDDIVDAFAAGDATGVFNTIDKVIEVGQDPRRFGEDLLRRLRDLVILSAVPSAVDDGILEVAEDQAERLKTQASGLGAGELTRAAEVIASGLTQMRGTTAPRLHLELMCARVLLPGADLDERGLHARMDRLERRVGMMGVPAEVLDDGDAAPTQAAAPSGSAPTASASSAPPSRDDEPAPPQQRPVQREAAPPAALTPEPQPTASTPPATGAPAAQRPAGQAPRGQRPAGAPPGGSEPPAAPVESSPSRPAPTGQAKGQLTTAELRRAWPTVLEEVKRRRRFTYMLISQNAQVQEVSDGLLVLAFANAGARDNFGHGGSHDILVDSLIEVLGVELRIQGIVATEPLQREAPAASPGPVSSEPPVSGQTSERPSAPEPGPAPNAPVARPAPSSTPPPSEPDYGDLAADDHALDPTKNAKELLARELGAQVISVERPGDEPA